MALVGSFTASALATLTVRALARRVGFVDRPGGHKQHGRLVALGGGIAVTWTVCLPIAALTWGACWSTANGIPSWVPEFVGLHLPGVASKASTVAYFLGGAVLLHVVGLIDDLRPLGPLPKLMIQIAAAGALAVGCGVRLLTLPWLGDWIPTLLTVLWIVVVTNAFNFLDNMDGLCAGVVAIAGTILAAAAIASGQVFVPLMMLGLVGAVLGFLVFNFSPASIFLGDAGSLVVGYLMGVLVVLTTFYDPGKDLKPAGVLLPLVVLAVPLYDVASVVVRRRRAGVSVWRGDRRHFSHRLVERGFSERAAVLTIYLATLGTSLGAVLLPRANWSTAALIFAQCLCMVSMIATLEQADAGPSDGPPSAPPSEQRS